MAGKRNAAAVGGDPDAVHAGADHHPDLQVSLPARRTANTSLCSSASRAQPRPATAGPSASSSAGVEAGQAPDPDLGQRAAGGREAGVLAGGRDQLLERLHGGRDPEVVV